MGLTKRQHAGRWLVLICLLALLSAHLWGQVNQMFLRVLVVGSEADARRLLEQHAAGTPFRTLAREFSLDPSAARGGYLGQVALDRLNRDFQRAAATLRPGQTSPPFSTAGNWVVLYRLPRDFRERAELLHDQGLQLIQQGDVAGAIERYQQALDLYPDFVQAYLSLGVAFGESGQAEKELASYQRALQIAPDFGQAHYNLGRLLQSAGQPYAALGSFKKALELRPDFSEALVNLAALHVALDQPSEAIAAARRAVQVNPLLPSAHYNLGLALAQQDLRAARESFRMAAVLDPSQLDASLNAAIALARLNELERAEAELRDLISRHPDYEPASRALRELQQSARPAPPPPPDGGAVLTQIEQDLANARPDQALNRIETERKAGNDSLQLKRLAARTRVMLGNALQAQGRLGAAVVQWQAALEEDSQAVEALIALAGAATRQGAFETAATLLDRAAASEPDRPSVLLAGARLEYERRRFRESLDLIERLPADLTAADRLELIDLLLQLDLTDRALEIASSSEFDALQRSQLAHTLIENSIYQPAEDLLKASDEPQSRLQLSHLYLRQLRFQEALPVLQNLLAERFRPWQSRLMLGRLYVDSGEAEKAVQVLQEAVQLQPANVNGIYQLGVACWQAGDGESARKWLKRGLELEPNSDRLRYELGRVLLEMGELEEALPQLKEVVSSQPDHPRAHYLLGSLYRELGQPDSARAHLERFRALEQQLEKDRAELKARKQALKDGSS